MTRIDMHRLQEMVRLHRMGAGARKVAQLLVMSPNPKRAYRKALSAAGLLDGPSDALPEHAVLREAVQIHLPPKDKPQHESSITKWTEVIEKKLEDGAAPTAIYDCLRLQHEEFDGSLSAVKRLCKRLRLAKGIEAEDVVIPVGTAAGEVAQVDFGSIGKRWDFETGRMREAFVFVFVLVLGYSRHMVVRIVFDQTVQTWLRLHVEAFIELGAVPRVLVPDNLKAAVIRAAGHSSGGVPCSRPSQRLQLFTRPRSTGIGSMPRPLAAVTMASGGDRVLSTSPNGPPEGAHACRGSPEL